MARTINYNVDGHEARFECSTRDNRSGFVHEATLFIDGDRIGSASIQYYNRTWERFTYQSVMFDVVDTALEADRSAALEAWKAARGYKRLTKQRAEEYEAARVETDTGRTLRALRFAIYYMPTAHSSVCGVRERDTLRDTPLEIVPVDSAPGHEVYRIIGASGASCLWDQVDKRFVG